jgi:hypothetical protein
MTFCFAVAATKDLTYCNIMLIKSTKSKFLMMSKSGDMRGLAGFVMLRRPYFKGHNDCQVVNANGDFELYFAEADKTKFRNVKAFKSH